MIIDQQNNEFQHNTSWPKPRCFALAQKMSGNSKEHLYQMKTKFTENPSKVNQNRNERREKKNNNMQINIMSLLLKCLKYTRSKTFVCDRSVAQFKKTDKIIT